MKLTVKLPNLSLTRGQLPPDVAKKGRARNFGKKLRKIAGWGALSMLFFFMFAWLALPTRAIAWRISHEAKAAGFTIDVEDITVWPWGSATLEEVTWTFQPSRPDMPPQQYYMEEVDASVSLLSLLGGTIDVEAETEREDGRIWARYVRKSDESTVEFTVEDLPLYDVPKATQALNVPLTGLVAVDVKLTAPDNKFSKAHGKIDVQCAACRAGDGESKLYVPGSRSLKQGLTIPEIDLGTLLGKIDVEKGTAKIDGAIETESEDLKMTLTGSLKLKDKFQSSRFKMVLKVELTDAFQERAEAVRLMYQGATKSKLKPPEKGLGFRLEGPIARPKLRGINSKSRRETTAERRAKQKKKDARRTRRKSGKKDKKDDKKDEKKDDDKKDDEKKDDDKKDDEDKPRIGDPVKLDPNERRDPEDDRPALPPSSDDPPPRPSSDPPPEPEPDNEPVEQPEEPPQEQPQGEEGGNQQPQDGAQGGSGGQQRPPAPVPEQPVE